MQQAMQFDVWFTLFVCVVGLMAAAGAALLLVSYIDVIPRSVAKGWGWAAVTVLLPLLGPVYFCSKHWQECSKTGKQLIGGILLLGIAVGLLYGLGPWFAKRAMGTVAAMN